MAWFHRGLAALFLTSALNACGGSGSSSTASPLANPVAPVPPPAAVLASSAGPGVSEYPTALTIPGLNRQRHIRLYVPPGYATSTRRYPVIYMHDAQNLFDNAIAQAGEWRIDETLDELSASGQLEAIVVGIDRGGEIGNLWVDPLRMTELNPFDHPTYGPGEGRQYMEFIVKVVKPLIDKQYRTKPERINTAIMGASLGGLITHYGIAQYPEVFSKAAIFSPSYAFGMQAAYQYFDTTAVPKDARLYLLVGGAEDRTMIRDAELRNMAILASGHPSANLSFTIVPGGQHGEIMYRNETKAALLWLFAPPQ